MTATLDFMGTRHVPLAGSDIIIHRLFFKDQQFDVAIRRSADASRYRSDVAEPDCTAASKPRQGRRYRGIPETKSG